VGLPVSSYFSMFKILWLIENVKEVKQNLLEGNIRFGTIDTWIIYNLTGRFVTDASNASRTYLYNLKGYWD
jgi:glycerol kinase